VWGRASPPVEGSPQGAYIVIQPKAFLALHNLVDFSLTLHYFDFAIQLVRAFIL
jgi:hypothetical protein